MMGIQRHVLPTDREVERQPIVYRTTLIQMYASPNKAPMYLQMHNSAFYERNEEVVCCHLYRPTTYLFTLRSHHADIYATTPVTTPSPPSNCICMMPLTVFGGCGRLLSASLKSCCGCIIPSYKIMSSMTDSCHVSFCFSSFSFCLVCSARLRLYREISLMTMLA